MLSKPNQNEANTIKSVNYLGQGSNRLILIGLFIDDVCYNHNFQRNTCVVFGWIPLLQSQLCLYSAMNSLCIGEHFNLRYLCYDSLFRQYLILITHLFSVSSVLNKDTKQFGKKFLTDGNEETCWNSDSADQFQWILCQFKQPIQLSSISIQFQGGFSSRKIIVHYLDDTRSEVKSETIYPIDNNLNQSFELKETGKFSFVRFGLYDCSDMFCRVIVYDFKLFGTFNT